MNREFCVRLAIRAEEKQRGKKYGRQGLRKE